MEEDSSARKILDLKKKTIFSSVYTRKWSGYPLEKKKLRRRSGRRGHLLLCLFLALSARILIPSEVFYMVLAQS